MKKKLLLISYYWPPSGGGGVQRCLKHVKYFRDFGWEPVVYTAENAEYPILDHSLEAEVPEGVEVVKHPIWEPYSYYKAFIGQKQNERVYSGFLSENQKPKLSKRISMWIRGNLFIPDARAFWVKSSIKFLTKYLKENPVDGIISSGPPHSVHLIARGVKKNLGLPWIADFRDPWTNIDFYDQLMLTDWADRKHKRLEKAVLKEADHFVTVTWQWAEDYKKMGADKVSVITNGFDHADFEFEKPALEEKFAFSHFGSLNADRNPLALWDVFQELCEETPEMKNDLRIRLVGKTDISAFAALEERGLLENVEKVEYMPHNQMLKELVRTQVLLLIINDTPNAYGIVPGKLYEYLAARRPILGIGFVKGDSARILNETGAGVMCDFQARDHMKSVVREMYQKYQAGKLNVDDAEITHYTRQSSAGRMAKLMDELTGKG